MRDLVACASNAGGILHLTNAHFNVDIQQINMIRGTQHKGVVDSFYILVGTEFVKWCLDVFHFILFCLLLAVPWRWIECLIVVLQHPKKWYTKMNKECLGMMEHAHSLFTRLHDFLFEPTLNDLVKEAGVLTTMMSVEGMPQYRAASSNIIKAWCDQMQNGFFQFEQEIFKEEASSLTGEIANLPLMEMKVATYDMVVKKTSHAADKLKLNVPVTGTMMNEVFQIQLIQFWLKMIDIRATMHQNHQQMVEETRII
ncbi:hypothetical protein RFI_26013, partial [Reticulomyxa filosa]